MSEENLIKIGYFRKVSNNFKTSYIAYKEFYSQWDEEAKGELKRSLEMNQCRLFCGCCRENNLELTVTSNYVVRVRENKGQSDHMDSCPKSRLYDGWHSETAGNGVRTTEDEKLVLNITLPSVVKSSSSGGGSSSGGSSSEGNKRTNIYESAVVLNKLAWEKQTYSVRKKIKEANLAGLPQTWEYKNIDDFNRLIFGVSNEVFVRVRGEVIPFIQLCYRKDLFYECDDWRRQWFMYAVVEKISEVKQERKYQYVTVRMPSLNSNKKAVIRIETDIFNKIFNDFCEEKENMYRILCGYVCRKSYPNDDGTASEWIHFLKGTVFYTSIKGLIAESETVAEIADYLCEKRIVFKRPIFALENYGGEIPTFIVERYNKKDLILDVPPTDKLYAKREGYIATNEEYDIVLLTRQNYREQLAFLLNEIPMMRKV